MVLKISSNKLLKDVKIIENDKFYDKRGFFTKFFHKEIREALGFNINEIFYSENHHGVIRGIHYQKKDEKLGKIIKCITGEVLDFFIDLRKNSKTYGHYSSQVVSEENNLSVFVPEGFGTRSVSVANFVVCSVVFRCITALSTLFWVSKSSICTVILQFFSFYI